MVQAHRRPVRLDQVQHCHGPVGQPGGHVKIGAHLIRQQVADLLGRKSLGQYLRAGVRPQLEGDLLGQDFAGPPQQERNPTGRSVGAGDQTQKPTVQHQGHREARPLTHVAHELQVVRRDAAQLGSAQSSGAPVLGLFTGTSAAGR